MALREIKLGSTTFGGEVKEFWIKFPEGAFPPKVIIAEVIHTDCHGNVVVDAKLYHQPKQGE